MINKSFINQLFRQQYKLMKIHAEVDLFEGTKCLTNYLHQTLSGPWKFCVPVCVLKINCYYS